MCVSVCHIIPLLLKDVVAMCSMLPRTSRCSSCSPCNVSVMQSRAVLCKCYRHHHHHHQVYANLQHRTLHARSRKILSTVLFVTGSWQTLWFWTNWRISTSSFIPSIAVKAGAIILMSPGHMERFMRRGKVGWIGFISWKLMNGLEQRNQRWVNEHQEKPFCLIDNWSVFIGKYRYCIILHRHI